MPGWWITAIVFFVIAALGLIAMAAGKFQRSPDVVGTGFLVTAVAGVIGVICTLTSCYDRVDTRNVGIITTFGNPVGVHGAGVVWHAPWKKVSELPESIQLQAFESGSYDEAAAGKATPGASLPAISVRLANNSTSYVDINLNWRLREGAAPKLFQDYGGGGGVFETIKEQLVDRQAQVMVSKVFSTFNPQLLTPVQPGQTPVATPATAQGADLPRMANEVKKDLQDAVGQEIEILDVRIPRMYYDKATQDRIDQYNTEVQQTLNASQQVKTAEQQRLAAEQRANQPPPDLRIAIFNCLNDQVKNGKDPAGCWGQIGGQPLIQMPKP